MIGSTDFGTVILWTAAAFLSGSIPFSVWIGRFILRKDIRAYGDGNPGATNVKRAGGKGWFFVALMLDVSKSAFPIGLAYWINGMRGPEIIPIALAPVFGHAFSPFLGFNGGKALAAAAGTWIGLTIIELPLVLIIMLVYWFYAVTVSGWAVLFTGLSGLLYLLLAKPDPVLIAVMVGEIVLTAYKHRADLRQPLAFRRFAVKP